MTKHNAVNDVIFRIKSSTDKTFDIRTHILEKTAEFQELSDKKDFLEELRAQVMNLKIDKTAVMQKKVSEAIHLTNFLLEHKEREESM